MKPPIILITNTCPFRGEVFLKNELEHIPADQPVVLFPILVSQTQPPENWDKPNIRVVTDGAHPRGGEKLAAAFHALSAVFRSGELREIFRKPHPERNLLKAVKFAWLSDSRARAIRRWLKANPPEKPPVFYSYWFYESSYAAARLCRHYPGSRFLSRCHGYDLYEIRHPNGYLPFRPFLMKRVDALCPISQDGVEYLRERFPEHRKIFLARLGTEDHGLNPSEGALTLVSCSNLLPVKRVDLLIRGLKQCGLPLRWYHFGDGPLMDTLRAQARELPGHIQWQFMGNVPNGELMEFYRTHHVTAFLNVSSSEGVPVSVMEAMSFGIPIIATNVGGTHEIVTDGQTGILLPADPEPAAIAEAVCRLAGQRDIPYRANARAHWQDRCDANLHYRRFYDALDQLGG